MAIASSEVASDTSELAGARSRLGPAKAIAGRVLRDARVRTIGFAYLFAIYSYIQPVGYRHAFPTSVDRFGFAQSFGNNMGIRIFYGEPHDLVTVNGYTAWRVGGTLAIAAAIFGVLAAVRALRAEEDSGRTEVVLAGVVGRRAAYLAALSAIGAGTLLLWAAEFVGFVVGGLPVIGAAYLALATVSVIPVFAGIGAVASEIAPTRRMALELGSGCVALFLLLRVIADTAVDSGWLRWFTPLGWAEELRPFAGSRPLVLFLPIAATLVLTVLPMRLGRNRDIGSGLISAHDSSEARLGLLSSPTAQAFRSERGTFIVWTTCIGAFGFILGVVSESISSAGISKSVEREIARLGSGSIVTPVGYLSFIFFFFVLAISLFACAQLVAARREEADGCLETLLALPVGRLRWLGGRLLLATVAVAEIAIASGMFTWAGARVVGVDIAFPQMLEAGANCIPVAIFFLGIAALSYAVAPRASAAVSYGIVIVTFLWQAVGSLLGAPRWVVNLTPFAYVGLVPTQAFRMTAAVVMIAIGAIAALVSLGWFRRRDLLGA